MFWSREGAAMTSKLTLSSILFVSFLIVPCIAIAAAEGNPRLVDAARVGDWNAVRSMVADDRAAVNSVDVDGTTPLHWAIRANETEIADLLLRSGANAKAQDRLGITPLYLASANGNGAIIRKLLEAGANPNQTERTGETILMVATRTGDVDAVRALLERGANPNATEPQLQLTALMLAAEGGYTDVVAALMKHGADIQGRTRTGATPAPKLPCVDRTGCGSHGVGIIRGGLPEQGIRAPIPGAMTP